MPKLKCQNGVDQVDGPTYHNDLSTLLLEFVDKPIVYFYLVFWYSGSLENVDRCLTAFLRSASESFTRAHLYCVRLGALNVAEVAAARGSEWLFRRFGPGITSGSECNRLHS